MNGYDSALYLTRAGWRGGEAAWGAFIRCMPLLDRGVEQALRAWPQYRDRRDDLSLGVLSDRAERVLRERGLPCALPLRDPGAWLTRVFRCAASDQLRAWARIDRRREERELDALAAEEAAVAPEDLERAEELLAALPPRYALAWLLRYAPECLELEHVRRAWRPGDRSGLSRDPEVTWRALEAWRRRHAGRYSSHGARRELAWILRSRDEGDPEDWARSQPRVVRRAMDAVGTWERRARSRLRAARAAAAPVA